MVYNFLFILSALIWLLAVLWMLALPPTYSDVWRQDTVGTVAKATN